MRYSSTRGSEHRARRLIAVGLIGLPMLVVAFSATTANVIEAGNPTAALALWPWDTSAAARVAGDQLTDDVDNEATRASVEREARDIISKAPIGPVAYRLSATVAAARGDTARADSLMNFVEGLTRRDALSQFYLIERAVSRGGVRDALNHYAIVLDTQPETHSVLFPLLVQAASQTAILPDLADFLASGGQWRDELTFKIASMTEPVGNVKTLFDLSRRKGYRVGPEIRGPLIDRLQTAGRFSDARAEALLGRPQQGLIVNAQFGVGVALPPFDWSFSNTADASAGTSSAGKGAAFSFRGLDDAVLAQQVIVAAPGKYRLATEFDLDSGDAEALSWEIDCVGGGMIAKLRLSGTKGMATTSFAIPMQNCPAQRLKLHATHLGSASELSGTIRWVRLEPEAADLHSQPLAARGR